MAMTIGSVLTERGAALLAKLHAQELPLEITRVAVGNGDLPPIDPIYKITELANYVMGATIVRKINPAHNQASIVSQIGSWDVQMAFDVTEAGVYATDPDLGEILYAYVPMQDVPEHMPDNSVDIGKVLALDIIIIVGYITDLVVNITPSSFVSREEFEDTMSNLTPEDIGAAKVTKYNATLAASEWTASAPSTQTVAIEGINAGMTPVIDLLVSDDADMAKAELEAWGLIGRIDTGDGTITAYCYGDSPTVAINLQIKEVA